MEERNWYERHVLEAYLGEYAGEFDIDAIEAEATLVSYDTYTMGRRYWRDDIDLDEIVRKHDKA